MPCFLAALVLATVILVIAPMPPLDAPTVGRFLANLTMVPLLFGERVVDLPYWTLTYETVFYVCMAVLLALGLLRSVEWVGLAWIAIGLLFTTLVDAEQHRRMTHHAAGLLQQLLRHRHVPLSHPCRSRPAGDLVRPGGGECW